MPKKATGTLARASATRKHSINLSLDISSRLRRLSFDQRISEASITEYALREFFRGGDDARLASVLRNAGASGRRTITG